MEWYSLKMFYIKTSFAFAALALSIFLIASPVYAAAPTWTMQSSPEDNTWRDIVYGNGVFVAVSSDGTHRVMTSPDGITWTARDAVEANIWIGVAYGSGVFVAVAANGTHRVMTSPDGITWTARDAAEANVWLGVTYGSGLFVAVSNSGTHRVMTSPDGITWTARGAAENNRWIKVTYGNGVFVAITNDSIAHQFMSSTDGITWAARTAPYDREWLDITYGGGQFVAIGQSGTNRIATSPDGVTWTGQTPPTSAVNWQTIAYGNGIYVGLAASGPDNIMTSSDGVTWTTSTAPEPVFWLTITYGNGIFVAVTTAGSGSQNVMTGTFPSDAAQPAVASGGGGLPWCSGPLAPGWNVTLPGGGCGKPTGVVVLTATSAPTTTARTSAFVFTRPLSKGMTDPDVTRLQQFLNTHNFPVASTGEGSLGKENIYFGAKTAAALKQFQKSVDLKPTGYVGPMTLARISATE